MWYQPVTFAALYLPPVYSGSVSVTAGRISERLVINEPWLCLRRLNSKFLFWPVLVGTRLMNHRVVGGFRWSGVSCLQEHSWSAAMRFMRSRDITLLTHEVCWSPPTWIRGYHSHSPQLWFITCRPQWSALICIFVCEWVTDQQVFCAAVSRISSFQLYLHAYAVY